MYKNPTEVITIASCQTVKSVEEEINKPNAFVRPSELHRLIETRGQGHDVLHAGGELRREGGLDRGPRQGNDQEVSHD